MEKLAVPCGVVINRSGEGDEATEAFCATKQLPLLGRIPFDRAIAEAYAHGRHPVYAVPELGRQLEQILDRALACARGDLS
jgi:MinD superfamily P-loop ATPase